MTPTSYNVRNQVSTSYNVRPAVTGLVMSIITTWFWDDLQIWQDERYWIDTGGDSFSITYNTRPLI